MNFDRFKDFDPDVRNLVLSFESQQGGHRFFDVDQLEIIADYYLEVADVEGLEAAVTFGERLYPANDEIRLRRAHLWSITGQYAKALKLLKELEQKSPSDTDVCYAQGAIYSMTDQPRKAIEYYLRAASDGCEMGIIYGNIADEYYKLRQFDVAIQYYRRALKADPYDENALYNLTRAYDESNQLETAAAFLQQMVDRHPYNKAAWLCLGRVFEWMSLYEKAVDALEYATAIDNTFFPAYLSLADNYLFLKQYPKAIQTLHEILPHADDRSEVLYLLGYVFSEMGNYHSALAYLREAFKENPAHGDAWGETAWCYERMGYPSDAEECYRHAIDVEPDIDQHWIDLADFYLRAEDYRKCSALLENGRTDAADTYPFESRLVVCYYHMERRNRMLHIVHAIGRQSARHLQDLIRDYPELTTDLDIMHIVKSTQP